MKLPAGVLAKLCALGVVAGCEAAYQVPPQAPTQPEQEYEEVLPDPRLETIEPREFAKPPPEYPSVAPVQPVFVPAPPPRKQPKRVQPVYTDPCPACGMG